MATPCVLVVDGDPDAMRATAAPLLRQGMRVARAADAPSATGALQGGDVDLVLLELDLPGTDGFALLESICRHHDVPVIVVTVRHREADRIRGFDVGADDYILKPFDDAELVARVRSALRRPRGGPGAVLDLGRLVINTEARQVLLDGRVIAMTRLEFDLLAVLASEPRRTHSRAELLRAVWRSSAEWQSEATVTEHIRRLRRKLGVDPRRPTWIMTVWGTGYRFQAEPRRTTCEGG